MTDANLPTLTFLYTLDQIAAICGLTMHDLQFKYLYYHLRSTGRKPRHQMVARNIAPDDADPDWRVNHEDFLRWLKYNGFEVKYPGTL